MAAGAQEAHNAELADVLAQKELLEAGLSIISQLSGRVVKKSLALCGAAQVRLVSVRNREIIPI